MYFKLYNITTTILNIIQHPVFYSKHNFSDIRFCLRLQVEPTQLGPINRASLCLQAQRQGERDYLCQLGPNEVTPEDGNWIQSSKCFVLTKWQDDG
jgi:hypothetical protein